MSDNEQLYILIELVLDDSSIVKPYSIFTLNTNEELLMTPKGDSKYYFTMVPELFFEEYIPAGRSLRALDIKGLVRESYSPANQSNATKYFQFGCVQE